MRRLIIFFCVFLLTITKIPAQESTTEEQEELIVKANQKAAYYLKELQIYYKNGDYQLHKNYSDSLYIIAKEHNFTKMNVLALVNQAVFYKNRSEQQEALNRYHEALEKCKLIPDDFRTNIIVLVNLGNIYDNIGLPNKAIETMQRALTLTKGVKNSEAIRAAALIGLSNNYSKIKDYEKTLTYAYEAKKLAEEINSESNELPRPKGTRYQNNFNCEA